MVSNCTIHAAQENEIIDLNASEYHLHNGPLR